MSQHLVTTQAKGGVCSRCRRPVLSGIAEGLNATVDLTAAEPTGQTTYALVAGGLVIRDHYRKALDGPILTEHKCSRPIQEGLW